MSADPLGGAAPRPRAGRRDHLAGTVSWTDALAVEDGRIVALGGEARDRRVRTTEVLDLTGRALLPASRAGHLHPLHGGAETLDCDLADTGDVEEVRRRLTAHAAADPDSPRSASSNSTSSRRVPTGLPSPSRTRTHPNSSRPTCGSPTPQVSRLTSASPSRSRLTGGGPGRRLRRRPARRGACHFAASDRRRPRRAGLRDHREVLRRWGARGRDRRPARALRCLQGPATGGHDHGTANWEPVELARAAAAMDAAGFQLHLHVIGDAAVRMALDAIGSVAKTNGPVDRRLVLAHTHLVHPDDLPRFRSLGVVANFESLWAQGNGFMRELTVPRLGPERAGWHYPTGSRVRGGAHVSFGSDWPVSSHVPLRGVAVR